jgi:hypothetical protein
MEDVIVLVRQSVQQHFLSLPLRPKSENLVQYLSQSPFARMVKNSPSVGILLVDVSSTQN